MTDQVEKSEEIPEFHSEQRRTFGRFLSRFPVKYKDTRCDFGADVFLRNLSADGAKITVKERLYINDTISLEVELLDGKGPMTIRGEVIWTKEKDPSLWDVGLKFHKVVLMDLWRVYEEIEGSSAE